MEYIWNIYFSCRVPEIQVRHAPRAIRGKGRFRIFDSLQIRRNKKGSSGRGAVRCSKIDSFREASSAAGSTTLVNGKSHRAIPMTTFGMYF